MISDNLDHIRATMEQAAHRAGRDVSTIQLVAVSKLVDVPTMQEQGMDAFDVTSWLGIYAPTGVPAEIAKKLSNDIVEGLSTPEQQKRLITAGFEPKFRRVDEFVAWNNSELKRWGDLAKSANISFNYGG